MPSKGSRLCSSSGERWGGDKGHPPQTVNHRNKANPSATITPRLWPQTTHLTDPTPHPNVQMSMLAHKPAITTARPTRQQPPPPLVVTDNASHRSFPAPQRPDVNACPQTATRHNKASPSTAATSPLVVTDNATHRSFPVPQPQLPPRTPPPLAQGYKPMPSQARPGGDGEGAN
ncbi:MAG: hypothetical protein GY832_00005 [Chloroflexi bacterium]|nr:hypothetical protein [Chloroflexota bacterium]